MQANLIELSMYQLSQLFLFPTLLLIAALFLYAFWVLGEFALLALYRRKGKGRPLVAEFRQNSRLTADDLDLIAYADVRSDVPELLLPHPRAAQRDFVLRPWLSIDPDAVIPGVGRVDAALAALEVAAPGGAEASTGQGAGDCAAAGGIERP